MPLKNKDTKEKGALSRYVTLANIYNYIEYLFSEGLKPNTANHQMSILSCVLKKL